MSCLWLQSVGLFAAAGESGPLRALEFDLPESPLEWAVYGGGFTLVMLLSLVVYIRDTTALSVFWKFWLTALRFGVLAALVVIAINPQERTQKMSYRPSRVAVLVDTSLSMRYPQTSPPTGASYVAPGNQQSRAAAIAKLFGKTKLIEELRAEHEVSLYTFDAGLTGPHHVFHSKSNHLKQPQPTGGQNGPGAQSDKKPEIKWDEMFQPQGLETRLGESLIDIMRQVGGQTLSGVVVFTDGAANAGIETSSANEFAKSSRTRLVTVGVGSTQQSVNLQIANVQSPTDVHVEDAYEIIAYVQGAGLAGRSVEVELLMKSAGDEETEPTSVATQQVTLREDGIPVEVKFQRTPSVAGSFEFLIRTKPVVPVHEISLDDNDRRKTINIADRKTRVLMIAGGPMRDYRFVRNMLNRHAGTTVDVWLQSVEAVSAAAVSQDSDNLLIDFPATAAELFEYDVILAFDPDWKRIPPDRLAMLNKWVSDQAGGLVLVAGDVFTPELASAEDELESIRVLYPVFLYSYLLDPQIDIKPEQASSWSFDFTREGSNSGFLQLTDDVITSAEAWKEFEGVFRCYPTAGEKAGSTVYAHFSDPRAQNEHGQPILLASQFYGSGRTFYLGSPEMWRLRADSEEYYDRFWTKVIREVGQGRLKRGTSRGTALLERNEYVLGQTVRVRALLLDPQMAPLDQESVELVVVTPNGKPIVPDITMTRDPSRAGQFIGEFRASLPGTYRLEVPIPESNVPLKFDPIDVVLPSLESDHTQQNAKLLTDLVRDTGGKYIRLEDAEKELVALLPNRGEEFLVDERLRTLWDREWVLYLLVGFLSLEWLTRKLLKLA